MTEATLTADMYTSVSVVWPAKAQAKTTHVSVGFRIIVETTRWSAFYNVTCAIISLNDCLCSN